MGDIARRFVTLVMSPILNFLISIQCANATQNLSHGTLDSESGAHHVIGHGADYPL